jgi:hypothetical protein
MMTNEERARQVEAVVQRRWLVKLAPALAGVLGLLQHVATAFGEVPADLTGTADLRRSTERHLAFSPVFPRWGGVLLVPLPWAILGGVSLAEDGHWRGAVLLWAAAAALLLAFLGLLALHLRALMLRVARCVVVPAQVSERLIEGWPTGEASVAYTFSGLSCSGILPANVPPICLTERTVELLVDPSSPTVFFVHDLYAAGPLPARLAAPDAEPLARPPSVDRYLERGYVPKLAPVVDLVRSVLEAMLGASAESSSPRSPLPPAPPLRATTRRALAFDDGARLPVLLAAIPGCAAVTVALGGLYRLVVERDAGGVAQLFAALGIAGLSVLAASIGAAVRVRALDRVFAGCVVVAGRTVSVVHSLYSDPRTGRTKDMQHLTLEYVLAGTPRQVRLSFEHPVGSMVGTAPVLLVDRARPDRVFVRDFYV